MKIFYMNTETGEITYSHLEACGWFKNHINIDMYNDDTHELVCTWVW